jgi:dsDNA-specific endonuclease/ATPase MutS2
LYLQVLAKKKHLVPGTVRDVSASGATLYIEPKGLEPSNTKLRQLAKREAAVVNTVLKDLSKLVGQPKLASELQVPSGSCGTMEGWPALALGRRAP